MKPGGDVDLLVDVDADDIDEEDIDSVNSPVSSSSPPLPLLPLLEEPWLWLTLEPELGLSLALLPSCGSGVNEDGGSCSFSVILFEEVAVMEFSVPRGFNLPNSLTVIPSL